MNHYKKFTSYLVENQPLLWHSKLLQMLFIGILANIISFLIGYGITGIEFMKTSSLDSLFFESFYVLFYLIFCLVVFTLWALTYFKNNAIKHFYPTDRFYIFKLFSQITFFIFIFCLSYFSFTYGSQLKMKSMFSKTQIEDEANAINQAYPLFGFQSSDFDFQNRAYPIIYNDIRFINLDNNSSSIENEDIDYDEAIRVEDAETQETILDSALAPISETDKRIQINQRTDYTNLYILKSDTLKNLRINEIEKYGGKIRIIDNNTYVGYFSHFTSDSCENYKQVIDSFYDINLLTDLVDNHITNFSTQTISERKDSTIHFKNYVTELAPVLNNWVTASQKDEMISAMFQVKKLCSKYKVKNYINPEEIYKLWERNGFIIYDNSITAKNEYSSSIQNNDDNSLPKYYIEFEQLESIYKNAQNAYSSIFKFKTFLILLVFSLVFAAFIVLFEFADKIRFLFTIPLSGVISIVLVFINIFIAAIYYDESNSNYYGTSSFMISNLIISIIILTIASIGIFTNRIPKRIVSVFYYMSYFIFPFVFINIYALICELSIYKQIECGREIIMHNIEFNPIIGIIIGLISYFLFTLTVKSYLGREE